MYRQTQRRNAGGDPREICNHEAPSRKDRGLLIHGARRAREAVRAKAPGEQGPERTSRRVSGARRPATHGRTEMAGGR